MKNDNLYEYLAVIPPNGSVTHEAVKMKNKCKTSYGWDSAVWSHPHFTICNLIQPGYNQDKLTSCLERISINIPSFDIDLCNFGYFKGSTSTLYIRLEDKKQFRQTVGHIRKFFKPLLKPIKDYSPIYATEPHLTIAKGIPELEFKKVWPNWMDKKYKSKTYADRILLLRREFGAKRRKYERIGEYKFLGKGFMDTQLKLF